MEVSTSFSPILVYNYTTLENKLSMFCHCYSFLAGWISFLILSPFKIHLSNWFCSQNEDQKLIKNAELVTGINTYIWWKWICFFCETGHQFIADIAFLKLKEMFLFIWMKYENLPKQKSPAEYLKQMKSLTVLAITSFQFHTSFSFFVLTNLVPKLFFSMFTVK